MTKGVPAEIIDRDFAGSPVSKVEEYKPGLFQQDPAEASLDCQAGSLKL